MASSFPIDLRHYNGTDGGVAGQYAVKMLELSEMTGYIMHSQVPARSSLAEALGLPSLAQAADLSVTVQIEECLNKLDKNLPSLSLTDSVQEGTDEGLSGQRFLFHLR